jgi:hypothetical protein
MSDIEELQGRIMAAMDRATIGLEKLSVTRTDAPDIVQALEEERLVNAQLTERVKTLQARSAAEADKRREDALSSEARMDKLDTDLQKLRRANTELSNVCAALRAANEEGVGEPHLINKAMLAELDALRAARNADLAEASAILDALTPLIAATEENV